MPMTPLAALIEECKQLFLDTHGVTLTNGDIARRSGGRLTRQRVQQLAAGEGREMPGPDTIHGLSLGLQVPKSVVLERALAMAGYLEPADAADHRVTATTDPEGAVTAIAQRGDPSPQDLTEAALDRAEKQAETDTNNRNQALP